MSMRAHRLIRRATNLDNFVIERENIADSKANDSAAAESSSEIFGPGQSLFHRAPMLEPASKVSFTPDSAYNRHGDFAGG